jgi:multimeric flavodoxin WrbA
MAGKKIIVVLGSPRKEGNSTTLAKRVIAGAKANGAEVEVFYLHDMNISPCTACDECRDDPAKDCVIDDQMKALYPKLRRADALVIASPIYWFTMSAQTKLFMDRCYALGGPDGHALQGKQIGILLTYADADPFSSGAVNALRAFQDGFNYIGADIAGMLYGSAWKAGEIRENKELMKQAYELGKQLGSGDQKTRR